MLKGIGASPGIVLGKALVIEDTELVIERKSITDCEAEVAKLRSAVEVSKEELTKVKEKALAELNYATSTSQSDIDRKSTRLN